MDDTQAYRNKRRLSCPICNSSVGFESGIDHNDEPAPATGHFVHVETMTQGRNGAADNEPWVDTALYGLSVLLFLCVSWVLAAIAEFNASHIFLNPGIFSAKTSGLGEWLSYAQAHQAQLASYVFPFAAGSAKYSVPYALIFFAPAICVVAARVNRYRLFISACVVLCFALDLDLLLQFHGYNSANGGFDGAEFIGAAVLHILAGVLSIVACIIRIARPARARYTV